MAGLEDLTAQSLSSPTRFNWAWFVELCVCGIIALFFLFYFNRLFATLLSYGIRAYTWHHYRVWVDIQALQISLLGGRIFFKGVRYHGENETIFVHNGYITWRYWFRNVRQADLTTNGTNSKLEEDPLTSSDRSAASSRHSHELDEEIGPAQKRDNSEARVAVFVTGVEWFIYNRTPLYDALLPYSDLERHEEEQPEASTSGVGSSEAIKAHLRFKLRRRPRSGDTSSTGESQVTGPTTEKLDPLTQADLVTKTGHSTITSTSESADSDVTPFQSLLVQLLPVYIECSRAAISIGNENTRAILVTVVDKAKGHIDARGCGPHDLFRQIFEFDIEHPVVYMKPNPDFLSTQLTIAEHLISETDSVGAKRHWWQRNLDLQQRRREAIHKLRNLVPGLQSSVESLHHGRGNANKGVSHMPFANLEQGSAEWHGLSRYLEEDDEDDHHGWAHIDYARFSTILDCPSIHMTFYWDSPGHVKADHVTNHSNDLAGDINGVEAPAYGLDLAVRGGNVNYGPWADRLRAEIQSVFFPASYRSAEAAKPLKLGQWRQSTRMLIRVDVEEEVILRVPTRETSKDWRWRGKVTAVRDAAAIRKQNQKRHFRLRRGQKGLLGPDIRPFGWMSFSVATNSSVRYEMDLVASHQGYRNQLQLDLKDTRATTSVNHADLWRCSNQRLECDLSNPLIWNSQHVWRFNVANDSMDLFLLRDHMFLLTDLIADFTAGLKSDCMTFVPFEYKIGLHFDNLKLFLNANDFNIIDNPCDFESNAFLVLGARELEGEVGIPLKYFSASQNSVHFKAHATDGFMDFKTPVWNTLHSFASDERMATLKGLDLGGSYNYNAGTSTGLTDSLFMDVLGDTLKLHLQGFLIRYFMNVKENYFGDDLHFRTLEEHQSRLGPDNRLMPDTHSHPAKNDNDLDVILNVRAENSCALMPANIYVREENLRVDIMLVEADMRFTNYYMDLQVDSSPVEVSTERETLVLGQKKKDTSSCQLFIGAVSVYGHRLFGAPPTEPTYVCNWDFDVGTIHGDCSTQFLRILLAAVQSFVFTFDDEENALPITRATALYDVTFLRARVGVIEIWVTADKAALLIETSQSEVSFDDMAGQHFSKTLKAHIASITLAVVDPRGSPRRHERMKQHQHTLACVETSIRIVNIDKKAPFQHQRQLQQDHIKFHDLRTARASFLLHDDEPMPLTDKETIWSQTLPAMPVPDLPPPILSSATHSSTGPDSARKRLRLRPSSFLSSSSDSYSRRSRTVSYRNPPDATDRDATPTRNAPILETDDYYSRIPDGIDVKSSFGGDNDTFASPWIEPHFSSHKTRPDLSQMPIVRVDGTYRYPRKLSTDGAEQDYTDSEETLSHAAVYCNLPQGIRAFCLPALFPAVMDMLQDLSPTDPQSLLDIVQMSTMKHIKALTTTSQGEKVDFALHIPIAALRLVNDNIDERQLVNASVDTYELFVTQIRLNGRVAPTVTKQTHGQTKENIFLIQASVRTVDLCLAERSETNNNNIVELHASIQDIDFWISLQDATRGNLQLGSLEISTGGGTVDRLSPFVERTRVMVTNIADNFTNLDQAYAVRHLIYHLSLLHTDTTDPAFLIKPSYVLRSSSEHVRLADSWKVISRFRQRLFVQSPEEKSDLVEHQSCLFERQQHKAQQQIMESIDSWKTWDRDQEACGPILQAIFGKSHDVGQTSSATIDLELGIYLGQISVILDPGQEQSQFIIQSGDLHISQKPVLEDSPRHNARSIIPRSKIRVSMWFADMSLDLNWNLVELARSLVKQINLSASEDNVTKETQQSLAKATNEDLDFTIVAGTDFAAVRLRTINLKLQMAARNLKSSTVIELSRTSTFFSLLLASNTAHLKVNSQSNKLFNWKLKSPTVYGSYQQDERRVDNAKAARIAASCDRLRFDMKDDVVSVLELVDMLIRNEVVIIQEVVNSIEQRAVPTKTNSKPPLLKLEDIHVAFFLNNYKLHFCLLPSLHYSIIGMVSRTSIVPQKESQFAVHVDIKNNRHTLIEPDKKRRSTAATLEIPPLSGRFIFGLAKNALRINAHSTLEHVRIEADAVQACFEAAYKPRNVQRVKDCQRLVQRIQTSTARLPKAITRNDALPQHRSGPAKVILYSGHAIFEGFDIHCSAPAADDHAYRANLNFGLRETTLRIHNYHKSENIPLAQPQFEVNLLKVFMELHRKTQHTSQNYGRFSMGLRVRGTTQRDENNDPSQNYALQSKAVRLDLFTETTALVIDIVTFLQGRIVELTTAEERNKIKPLRRLTLANTDVKAVSVETNDGASEAGGPSNIFDTTLFLDLNSIQVRWIVTEDSQLSPGRMPEDLVFSIRKIDFRTQRESSASLTILDLQLQTVSKQQENPVIRTKNSALLPEMIFSAAHFSTKQDRRFAFQAAGKALDLRLAADGILPLSMVQRSLARATADIRSAKSVQVESTSEQTTENPLTSFLGKKRLSSLLVDADFAGAVVKVARAEVAEKTPDSAFGLLKGPKRSNAGRYGQAVQTDNANEAILRAPGIAVKVEYIDTGSTEPSLSTEVKVAASSNTLAPSVVPLVLEIYSSVKEIIGDENSKDTKTDSKNPAQRYLSDAATVETNPTAILGRVKLNAGLWVQRQEFSLTCQPIARVSATARFSDIFLTINTVQDGDQERFFSIITTFNGLQASVQHVYSRDSTASFEVDTIVMSLMNSKHVSAKNGISAILNISPMKASLNAKQMQDFLLFKEIWYPAELRGRSKPPEPMPASDESQAYAMQKYHELATTAALPWHAVVSIHELKLEIDFGQSLGKSSFMISKLWASSKKNSDWEQNLCVGFDRVGIDSAGRLSGFVELKDFRARTSIRWPATKDSSVRAPLVQASVGFGHLRLKTAFDYQPFAVADVSSFEFLMYNVRPTTPGGNDRLVGILKGGKVQVFCISAAAAQALSIVQAFERLFQEKKDAFNESLHEVDELLRRNSVLPSTVAPPHQQIETKTTLSNTKRVSHRLHTDVVVTIAAIDIGAFPNSFYDNQILKVEAVDAQVRFAVATVEDRVRSGLGMTLGQVRVALSSVGRSSTKALGEVEIEEVIERATLSRGGTILKVPRLVASMQTWQDRHSSTVEYIFRSTFQGKVDVGWNFSRIRFIRGMWDTHSQALAHRLGKPLPPSAVKIMAEPQGEGSQRNGQEKITAVVNVPQSSKFQYVALEPPIIDTPQLRDMGEATPPLEWIGLQRDKLPNVTHSIVIVSLLEVAKEVEEAYTRILGTG